MISPVCFNCSFVLLISLAIAKYKQQVALGEALERLEVNPDFRMLIELNYLGTHALDLVYSRTRDMTPDNEIARKIDAVAN